MSAGAWVGGVGIEGSGYGLGGVGGMGGVLPIILFFSSSSSLWLPSSPVSLVLPAYVMPYAVTGLGR